MRVLTHAGNDFYAGLSNRLTDPLVRRRNVESLRRLRRISETGVLNA